MTDTAPLPIEAIHWTELNGNRFQTKPTAAMLLHCGHTLTRKVGKRRAGQMEWKEVTFDTAYVRAYFAAHFADILETKNDRVLSLLCIALNPLLSPCGGHNAQVQE